MASQKEDDKPTPATPSMAWVAMSEKWQMIETLMSGTLAMRHAGETYCPRHEAESQANYQERIQRATLFNMMELTLDSLVGKPFSDPIKFKQDVPEQIVSFKDDLDLQGNGLSTFCRNWFREGLAKSFAHVLVELPQLGDAERGTVRTLADDQSDNRRPYWILIKPENVIFASTTVVNGVDVLTHVRIAESVIERDGFGEVVKQHIRVLEPGTFAVYEWQEDKDKRKKGKWILIESGQSGLPFIPMITFYANKSGFMEGKPPLEDLAHLNIRHWQSTSDQNNILTVARFPMLAVAGATDQSGTQMAIGPRQLLGTKDANGRFYYVEHSGKSIDSGWQDLDRLEQQMAAYGAQFLRRAPGGQTATARALDSAEAMSPLQDAFIRFVMAVNLALKYTAAWLKLDDGGTIDANIDFQPNSVNVAILTTLLTARKNGDLSREDFLQRLKELEIISDEFDSRINLMRLMYEMAGAGLDLSLVDPEDIVVPKIVPPQPPIQQQPPASTTGEQKA